MPEYKLPDVGEGLTEAEIVTWKVKVGDVIAINDIVVEIETAKSLVELPSPYAGTVTALLVPEGETVDVGTPIIAIGDASEAPAEPRRLPAPAGRPAEIDLSNPAASGGGEGESLVGRNKAEREAMRRPRKAHRRPRPRRPSGRPTSRSQASFVPGELSTPDVVEADEPAVPAYTPAAEAPAAANGDVRALPSRRCASWPRTSASTSPRWSARARVAWSRARTSQAASGGFETGASAPAATTGRAPSSTSRAASASGASRSRASAR